MLENVSDLVAEVDENGNYTYFSPNHLQVLGFDPATLLGRSALEFMHPDEVAQTATEIEQLREAGGSVARQFRGLRADGEWLWFEGVARSHRTPEGELRILSVARDITERRRLEQERALLTSLGEAINAQLDLHSVARVLSERLQPLLPFELFFITQVENDALRILASDLPLEIERELSMSFNRATEPGIVGTYRRWAKSVFMPRPAP